MKKVWFTALFCVLFSLLSCSSKGKTIKFDDSDPLAIDVEIQWAVIAAPYAACRKQPDYNSETINHFRKGALVQIKGQQTVNTDGLYEKWYNFDEGWVTETSLKVYSNKLKALNALQQEISDE